MKPKRYLVTIVTTIQASDEHDAMAAVADMGYAIGDKPFLYVKERQGRERAWESPAMTPWRRVVKPVAVKKTRGRK